MPIKQRTKKFYFLLSIFYFLVIAAFLAVFPARAQGASFYVSPRAENYKIGQIFNVDVFVDSGGVSINAAQAKIIFPAKTLKVVSISKANSIFSLWFQDPIFSNSKGEISFGGGLPSPGFKGKAGKVITISFQSKAIGQAKLDFKDGAILENGPKGTNLFSSSREGTYTIFKIKPPKTLISGKVPSAPVITSPTHQLQDKWYSNNNPEFHWKINSDITGVSFVFNQQPVSEPGDVSQGVFSSKVFKGVEDGVWYFHLKFKNEVGWGPPSHFKVQVDTQPPLPFKIAVDNEGDPTNPRPVLYFDTKDEVSGVSYYEIKIGEGDAFRVFETESNPFRMPRQAPGVHRVIVRAVDKAQNFIERNAEVRIEPIIVPEATVCPSSFVSGAEVMYIEGTAKPDTQILVFFKRDGKPVKKWEIASDEKGSWFLAERGLFRSGLYEVTALARDTRGALSKETTLCSIRVVLMGLAVGPWVIGYKTLTLIFLVIFILALISSFHFLRKARAVQASVEKETEDLRQKFYKEYNELRENIENELKRIRKAKGERGISGAEKKREEDLMKSLADIKRVFEKELRDIEEIK